MTKGRYVIAVGDVAIFLVVDDGQVARCRAYNPTMASWRRLTICANKQIAVKGPHSTIWVMPRKA